MRALMKAWEGFFFSQVDVRQYAALRMSLGSLTVIYLAELLPLSPLHFSQEGWLGNVQDLDIYNAGYWSLLFLLGSETQTYGFFLIAILFALGFTLGYKTRLCGLVTLIALVSLWNRNPLILDGDDALLRVMLFYLILSPCGEAFALDATRKRYPKTGDIWPLQLIRFQMALIYFVSGWVKLHSPEWRDGTILEYVLVHPDYSRWDFSHFFAYPAVLQALNGLAKVILWWEFLFPVLLVWSTTRRLCLFMGMVFHVGLLVFMNLRWFPWIMLTLYLAFIPDRYFELLCSRLRQRFCRKNFWGVSGGVKL